MDAAGYFSQLPQDILNLIFSKLYSYHEWRLACCCKYLRKVISEKYGDKKDSFAHKIMHLDDRNYITFRFAQLLCEDICFDLFKIYWNNDLKPLKWKSFNLDYENSQMIIIKLSYVADEIELSKIARFLLNQRLDETFAHMISILYLGEVLFPRNSKHKIIFDICYDYFRSDNLRKLFDYFNFSYLSSSLIKIAECSNINNFKLIYDSLHSNLKIDLLEYQAVFRNVRKIEYIAANFPKYSENVHIDATLLIIYFSRLCEGKTLETCCLNINFYEFLLHMLQRAAEAGYTNEMTFVIEKIGKNISIEDIPAELAKI